MPRGTHPVDQVGTEHRIEHRLIPTRHPQTHGMIERRNGRIREVLATPRLDSAQNLEQTLRRYVEIYHPLIPPKALGHIPALKALQRWQEERPEIFVKPVYNLTGLDTLREIADYFYVHYSTVSRAARWIETESELRTRSTERSPLGNA